jgi:SAM-dependent methyltransferase
MDTQIENPAAIKSEVEKYYGDRIIAVTNSGACCGDGCCSTAADSCCSTASTLYAGEDLSGVPGEVAGVSFGCGNPIALASLRPGEIVLDLGSGGGLDVLLAAQRVGPEGFVYGLDMTDAMLEVARKNAARAGATNVRFVKGEIEAIPLPDASVDVIISNCVINLSPDKGAALGEAARVLRPGGRLAVSDIVVDGDLTGLPLSEEAIRAGLSWAGCIAGALTRADYARLLAGAGFERIEVAVKQRYSVADLPGTLPAALADLPPAVLADLVSRFTSSAITAYRPA